MSIIDFTLFLQQDEKPRVQPETTRNQVSQIINVCLFGFVVGQWRHIWEEKENCHIWVCVTGDISDELNHMGERQSLVCQNVRRAVADNEYFFLHISQCFCLCHVVLY